ncbi:hypothetical protein B296_00043557 [Ensete ventricosum]|uniref:Uncharacterized protein n=1 Tax=Ensete ventricosum TaxID=4639 RepID=A0A426Y4V6_ENSVE|nr:hypothetical protein B296_00043557 [Ensete ventricosum]
MLIPGLSYADTKVSDSRSRFVSPYPPSKTRGAHYITCSAILSAIDQTTEGPRGRTLTFTHGRCPGRVLGVVNVGLKVDTNPRESREIGHATESDWLKPEEDDNIRYKIISIYLSI